MIKSTFQVSDKIRDQDLVWFMERPEITGPVNAEHELVFEMALDKCKKQYSFKRRISFPKMKFHFMWAKGKSKAGLSHWRGFH